MATALRYMLGKSPSLVNSFPIQSWQLLWEETFPLSARCDRWLWFYVVLQVIVCLPGQTHGMGAVSADIGVLALLAFAFLSWKLVTVWLFKYLSRASISGTVEGRNKPFCECEMC